MFHNTIVCGSLASTISQKLCVSFYYTVLLDNILGDKVLSTQNNSHA